MKFSVKPRIDPPFQRSLLIGEIAGVMKALSSAEAKADVEFNRKVDTQDGFYKAFEDVLIDRGDFFLLEEGRLRPDIRSLVEATTAPIIAEKERFRVRRPAEMSAAIADVLPFQALTADGYSYPSGHAAQAFFLAQYLCSQITSDYCRSLFGVAHRIGYGRVRIGVHYPQDFYAGRELGLRLYGEYSGYE
tara:strand:- start:584 stop:1153 length:570 start_codon:yes stop_codon:yes gene_type:complete